VVTDIRMVGAAPAPLGARGRRIPLRRTRVTAAAALADPFKVLDGKRAFRVCYKLQGSLRPWNRP